MYLQEADPGPCTSEASDATGYDAVTEALALPPQGQSVPEQIRESTARPELTDDHDAGTNHTVFKSGDILQQMNPVHLNPRPYPSKL